MKFHSQKHIRLLAVLAFVFLIPHVPLLGSTVFVPASNCHDMVFDPTSQLLYITTNRAVLRYNVANNTFAPQIDIGRQLLGIDISPDYSSIAIGDAEAPSAESTNHFFTINTTTNSVTRIDFPKLSSNDDGTTMPAFL